VNIAHFYHLWADGTWRVPAAAHAAALLAAQFPVMPAVGLVGQPQNRRDAAGWLCQALPGWDRCATADEGYEQVTLEALRQWCINAPEPAAVLYCHTKGAASPDEYRTRRREHMTSRVVGRWRDCVRLLGEGADAAGCNWLTAGMTRTAGHITMTIDAGDHFSGNFWWARSDYIAGLPPLPEVDITPVSVLPDSERIAAELWIGTGKPRVADLSPGWPDI